MSPIGLSMPLCPECGSPIPLLFESVLDMRREIMVCEGCGCWYRVTKMCDDPGEGADGLEEADQESW